MTAAQVFATVSNSLALIVTLSVLLLLAFRRNLHTRTGQALFQFLGSLAILQSGTLFTHISLQADLSDVLVDGAINLTLAGFFLVTLTALAVLLHTANAMKAAWQIFSRAGVVILIVLQPTFWQHDHFRFSNPPETKIFGAPYSDVGRVIALVSAAYVGLTLLAGWRYWRQIGAPFLTGSIMVIVLVQSAVLAVAPLRELSLTGATGGIVSGILGYHLAGQLDLYPQTSQSIWLAAIRNIAHTITSTQSLHDSLTSIADEARRLIRSDSAHIQLAIGPDRLEVVVMTGTGPSMVGRQVRVGEGLAGRIMQTLTPMRIDNYRTWNGRAADLDDVSICASLSVPLIYHGRLVGTMNVSEHAPGRVFTDRDQMTLELLASQATITIVTDHLERDLNTLRAHFRAILEHTTAAMFIFDSSGTLHEMNPAGRHYLDRLFGKTNTTPSMIQLAARAQDRRLTDALVQWTTNPATSYTIQTQYPELGILLVELQTIDNTPAGHPDLLMIMRAASDN